MGKRTTRSRGGLSRSGYREAALRRSAERLLDVQIERVEYPGGRSRESYRLIPVEGASFIGTRRRDIQRARIESHILRGLNRHQAPVPALLGCNHGHILFQQEILGVRLSEALNAEASEDSPELLSQALTSLARIQHAAHQESLGIHVEALGTSEAWLRQLIHRPSVIGQHLGIEAPPLDQEALLRTLQVPLPEFIKWDSRPGNALVQDDGTVIWFDWEHAGRRHRLDDMVWLMGDEFVPDDPLMESTLIEAHLADFAGAASHDSAYDYLMSYGSFHIVVRLGLILKYMDGEWWDLQHCIAEDKVGVTLECARRLCRRGARWASAGQHTRPLGNWFLALEPAIEKL